MMVIKESLLLWFTNFLKKSKECRVNIEVKPSEPLAEELHKPIIRKSKKRTVYSGFKNNIWSADMQLISTFKIKDLDFCCVLLTFLVNMLGLFL